MRPFWKDVFAPKYFALVSDLFAKAVRQRGGGGKFKSGAWAWLSPRYAAWKSEHYPGRPLLVREGTLRRSVTWSRGQLGPGGIFRSNPSFVVVGTSVPHATYHQSGTKHMPARPFLPPPDPKVFAPLLKQWLLRNQAKAKTS